MIKQSQIQQYQLKRDDNITIKIICMIGHRLHKNTDINLQSIPSEKSIYIQNKSVDSSRKLCQAHAKCFMDPRFSKSQIKSLSTLPSRKQIIFSKASIHEHSSKARPSSRNVTQNCTQTNVNRFMKPIVSKIAIKSKRHGHIYTNAPQSSGYRKNPIATSKSETMTEIQQENIQLRSKILDCELRQRQYVSVINNLEAKCIKLDEIIAKKANMQKNQIEFVKLMRQMFLEMFGISGIKAVWEKQKQIIEEWAEYKGERQGKEVQRMNGRGDRKNNPEDQEQQKQSQVHNGKAERGRREEQKQKVRD